MTTITSDRIERQILLNAPRARVWHALTDATQFGAWFGVEAAAPFTPGGRTRVMVVNHPEYNGLVFDMLIEEMVPERRFSWRWHPNAIDPAHDYSSEPTTLVTFTLEEAPGGTLLTLVESGFDAVPPERRFAAYRGNEQGWADQLQAIATYVSQA
jgi:uncharacterized protein YndB with AHSA1/START domain